MPRVKLDAAFCLTAECQQGKKKTDYWNIGDPSGFVLEVRESGGKTFYLRYFDQGGRQRQHKIGRLGDITFDQARKVAKRLRSEVVLGGDPLAKKQELRSIPLYEALAEQHIEHAKSYQRSWWSVEGILRRHIVPRWGKHRLNEIRTQDVARWFGEKTAQGLKPATVEKIRVVFGRSFELARRWNIPGAELNPVRGIPRPKFDNKRERFLTAEEAQRLLDAASGSRNPQLRNIVELLLLTGARVSELLNAEWRYVDLERRAWLIPTSKTGRSRYVPLSQAAIGVVQRLPRFPDSPYLVPNPETGKPFVSLKRAWQTTRNEAGLRNLRCHDLRHSAASFMINAGVDLYAVGRVLGHADHKSTMRYAHLANETLLAAVEAGAAKLNGVTL